MPNRLNTFLLGSEVTSSASRGASQVNGRGGQSRSSPSAAAGNFLVYSSFNTKFFF